MHDAKRTNRRSSIIILSGLLVFAGFVFGAPVPAPALDLGVACSGKWINAIPAGSSTSWLIGEGTGTFTWGDPAGFGTGANYISFQGASQTLAFENLTEPIKLGSITYFNGTVSIGTEAEGITLEITADISPYDLQMTFTYPAAIVTTPNSSSATADANADYIAFHSLSPEDSIDLGGGAKVVLNIWGFYTQQPDSSYDLTEEFHVHEGATTSADLYGQFEIIRPSALTIQPSALTVEALYGGVQSGQCSTVFPGHEEVLTISDGTSPYTVDMDNGEGNGSVYAEVISNRVHVYGKQAGTVTLTVTDADGATADIPVTVLASHMARIYSGRLIIPYLSFQGMTYSATFKIQWSQSGKRLELEGLQPTAAYSGAYSDDMAELTGGLADLVLTVPGVYVAEQANPCPLQFAPEMRFVLESMNPITFVLQQ